MDGTLLDENSHIPAGFDRILSVMEDRDIVFAPASGRQLATLTDLFPTGAGAFIAENGAVVTHAGTLVSTTPMAPNVWRDLVRRSRALPVSPRPGLVLCGVTSAYVEVDDAAFVAETLNYYHRLQIVDDLLSVTDDIVNVSLYDATDASALVAPFGPVDVDLDVIVSGQNWIDIMLKATTKGQATRDLQRALGVTARQTVAFGDYLNDLSLMDVADYSFAMDNAHPQVKAAARYVAPANTEAGVVTVLESLLGLDA